MEADKLIGMTEAAALLQCDRRVVRRLIEDGRLRPLVIETKGQVRPHRYAFRRGDVEALAREGWRKRAPRRKSGSE